MRAAVTADTGDAISPSCAAITLMESGRSGRMFALRATSAITGSSASITCSVQHQDQRRR